MPESIQQRINGTSLDMRTKAQLRIALQAGLADNAALKADVASLITQFNQLRTDYNANANIITDTTAAAVTNTSAATTSGQSA